MCTGLCLETKDGKHLFGRNLDVPASYGQSVHIIPEISNGLMLAIKKHINLNMLVLEWELLVIIIHLSLMRSMKKD